MSSEYKRLKHELKTPDPFQARMLRFFDALMKRKTLVFSLIGVVLAIMIASFGYERVLGSKSNSRRSELAKVDAIYNEEITQLTKQQQGKQKTVDDLRAQLEKAKTDKSGDVKALETQLADAEKAVNAEKANHAKSSAEYKKFYEANKEAPEGWAAGMRYAAWELEQGNLKEARPVLEQIIGKSQKYMVYQVQAGLALVSVLEDLNEYDAALQNIDSLMKQVPDNIKPKLLLAKGRIQLQKDNPQEANKTLESLIKDHGNSTEADQARGLKALLN